MVQNVLHAGAIGYLLKNVAADELAAAIRAAYAGRPTLAPEAAQVLIHRATHPAQQPLAMPARPGRLAALQSRSASGAPRRPLPPQVIPLL